MNEPKNINSDFAHEGDLHNDTALQNVEVLTEIEPAELEHVSGAGDGGATGVGHP